MKRKRDVNQLPARYGDGALSGLRHTFIGHIINEKTGRPITTAELEAAFNAAIDNDLDRFLRWIHISGDVPSRHTIVGALTSAHEELRARLE
jgi:hypothetical protein